jgi:lysophospholipase L1-like esterase
VILAVGSNDVWLPWLSGRSLGWWLWLRYRRLRHGVTPTTDLDAFAAVYRALIDRARTVAGARVLACTVSPLGEDLASPVNRQVARLNGAIKRVATDCQVPVADVWQAFVGELAPLRQPSRLLPRWSWSAWWDRRCLRIMLPDEISRRRHLQLTYDGIHLNRRGADLWAAAVLVALAREERSWRAADE